MPTALVTGATGFVGAAVLRELLRRRWDVRVLHRQGSDLRNLPEPPAVFDRRVGDLRDERSLLSAMRGADVVFHVAARYQFGLRHARDLFRDNHEGTRNILAAAAAAGVERIVYTSTVGVLQARADGVAVGEEALADFADLAGPYKRSKWLAEQEVIKAAAAGAPVVTVCPSTPVGPWDIKPTPTGQMIVDFLRGAMPAYVDTGLNLVAVEDVAIGHVLAAERGRPGERYILGHENLELRRILEILSRISGRPVPRWRIPRRLLVPLAYVTEAYSSLSGRSTRLSLENARMSQKLMFFDSAKACRELGYAPGSVEGALARAASWFAENGYLGAPARRKDDAAPGVPADAIDSARLGP